MTNILQKENEHALRCDIREIPFPFFQYRKEIKRIKPDVIIFFLHLKNLILWPLIHWAKLKGIPIVFWTKGVNLDAANSKIRYFFFNYIHSISDGLILYSQHEMRLLRPRNRAKAFPANNAINHYDFPEIKQTKEEIKKELGIPFDKVVLFAGRINIGGNRKKVDHLVEIFSKINDPGLGLVIVGSGMPERLLNSINKRNTVYLGEVHDPSNIMISKIFKMADIYSCPGHLGLGVNQAFYWGLPTITEDGLHPPEARYLEDGRNGYIVPNNDLTELKNKILYLLQDDQVRKEFSKNAREDILKNASIDNMFDAFKRCIESVIVA